MVVQLCTDPRVVDVQPPSLLAASATDATHVLLSFSEPIDPAAGTTGSFSIIPALAVDEAKVERSLREMSLTVAPQIPGLDYVVTVNGIADLALNPIAQDTSRTFTGFGAAPDRSPPELLAPLPGAVLTNATVALVWSRRAFARTYLVEVAYDPAFTQPLAGFPVIVEDPQTSVTHTFDGALRYHWRVRADTTSAGAYAVGSFDRIGEAIHVYCPDGVACDDDDAAGNVSAPFRTVSGAVAAARASGLTRLLVASRGGTPYREHVLVGFGLELLGGYTPSFDPAARDIDANPTRLVSDDGPVLLVIGGNDAVRVEGFDLSSSDGDAVRVVGGNVELTGNVIAGASSAVAIENTSLDPGQVVLSGNRIRSLTPASITGVRVSSAGATIRNNLITFDACDFACRNPVGIHAIQSDVVVTGNTVSLVGAANAVVNGVLLDESHAEVRGNRVTMGTGQTAAIAVNNYFTSLAPSVIANNILLGGVSTTPVVETAALRLFNVSNVVVANNVLYGGSGSNLAYGVVDGSRAAETIYVDNIIFTGTADVGAYCIYERQEGSSISDLRNNLMFGCATALYRDNGAPGASTTITQVNNAANTTQRGTATSTGNLTVASLAAVGFASFPDDLRFTAATPTNVRRGGLNTTQTACGSTANLTCGGVADDFDGLTRTCPVAGTNCFSIGPHEDDR